MVRYFNWSYQKLLLTCTRTAPYKDVRANETLCGKFQTHMSALGSPIAPYNDQLIGASTDMGELSPDLGSELIQNRQCILPSSRYSSVIWD